MAKYKNQSWLAIRELCVSFVDVLYTITYDQINNYVKGQQLLMIRSQ